MIRLLIILTLLSTTSCTGGLKPLMAKEDNSTLAIAIETGSEDVTSLDDTAEVDLFSSTSGDRSQFVFEELDSVTKDGRKKSSSSPLVRIALAPQTSKITLHFSRSIQFTAGTSHTQKKTLKAGTFELSRSGNMIVLHSLGRRYKLTPPIQIVVDKNVAWQYKKSSYEGFAVISLAPKGLMLINMLPVEEYLRGVVPLEIGARTFKELEALKAQAVAARTYTYSRMQARKSNAYDMLSTVSDQVYGGVGKAQKTTDSAIVATASEVLVDTNGKLIGAFYHSTCGGKTASINKMWNGAKVPYLQSVSDKSSGGKVWCSASSKMNWQESWSIAELSKIVAEYSRKVNEPNFKGTIKKIEVVQRSKSGRVLVCEVTSQYGTYRYGKDKIRQIFRRSGSGNPLLWSAQFDIAIKGNRVVASGHGFGHGIGMCQFGALGRAAGGQSYSQILGAYYHTATLKKMRIHE